MRKLIHWLRTNAAVIIATTTLASVVSPGVRDVSTAIAAAVTALDTPQPVEVRE